VVGYIGSENDQDLNKRSRIEWNIPWSAQVDDLILMYRAGRGISQIKDIWKVTGPFHEYKKGNRAGRWPGLQAGLQLVRRLNRPLTFSELSGNPRTKNLPIVRRRFQGKSDITESWPVIHDLITAKNPNVRKALGNYIQD